MARHRTRQARSPPTTRIELRTRTGINATSETARRARKLLFATDLWEHDQTTRPPRRQGRRLVRHQLLRRRLGTQSSTPRTARSATSGCGPSTSIDTGAFVDEVADVLRQMPRKGLIIDLRSNPGGFIDTAEQLLQLFTANRSSPARFACRATPPWSQIAEADGNGADLADWADLHPRSHSTSARSSPNTSRSATPTPATSIDAPTAGPVVAIVDANTFSCGDLFTAGIADHGIGTILAVGEATGAGGANVWTSDDIEYAYHAAGTTTARPSRPESASRSRCGA